MRRLRPAVVLLLVWPLTGCRSAARPLAIHLTEDTACARASDGIDCARWGTTGFGAIARWSSDFGDADGWSADAALRWTTLRTPDLDGDGKTDLCLLGRDALFCALRNGSTSFGPVHRTVIFDDREVGDWRAAASFAFADLDGDGHPDGCVRLSDGLYCALGTGDGSFAAATLWASWPFADAEGAAEPLAARSLRFGDLDGDGRDDVCLIKADAVVCALSTGSALAAPTAWTAPLWNDRMPRPRHASVELGDLDGDGREDVCIRDAASVRCFASTATAFVPLAELPLPAGALGLRLADLDGDGRQDLCVWRPQGLACACALAGGHAAFVDWELDAFAAPRFTAADVRSFTLVDIDGDGRADACGRSSHDGLGCALSDGRGFRAVRASLSDFGEGAAWRDRPDVTALAIGRRTQPSTGLSNRTARENELPGTTDWWVPYPQWSANHEIEAYTDATSYPAGGTVRVMLSTSHAGDSVAWTVLRTGWYGGDGARAIAAGRVVGNPQPLPPEANGRQPAQASWTPSFAIPLPRAAVSGVYALRLDSAVTGKSFFATFVVREDERRADLVVGRADYTDAAYNDWDGGNNRSSAYQGALWISFDRPLRSVAALGIYSYSSGYFVYEYSMVRWLESQGYDVKYVSDVDLDAVPDLLAGARAFLSVGHHEYWSAAMRDHIEAARDAGVHLGFFGSDAVDGRIRFADRRHRVFSRTVSDHDAHKLEYGGLALDLGKAAHDNPSDSLTGTHYAGWCVSVHRDCATDLLAKLRRADAFQIVDAAHPIFRGLGAERRLPSTVGYEYEVPFAEPSLLPFTVYTLASATDLDLEGVSPVMVAYRTPGGARVVNLGSMHWTHALDGWAGRAAFRASGGDRPCPPGAADCFARTSAAAAQVTANVLTDFGAVAATPSRELLESAPQPWP